MKTKKLANTIAYFFVFYYTVGLVGLSLPSTRNLFTSLMPLSIAMSTLLLLLFHGRWRSADALVLFFVALTGYLIEVLGVATGEIFGSYQYGKALGFQFLDTPLLIGVNWMMLSYCAFVIMQQTRLFVPLKVILSAALLVIYDVVLEPVAIKLDMWSWGGGSIPVQNYQAWFVISLIFVTTMHLAKIKTRNTVAPWLFGVQLVFFLLLNVTLRIFL